MVMDVELGKWALQIGGPMAGLLVLFFYFYRKDMQFYVSEMKTVSDERKIETITLITVIRDNTAALTRITEVVQSLHRHMGDGDGRILPR
jgi:hypothetical protein